ncbi:MAG: cytochrome P450 [Pirellulales bacterium]
MLATYSQRNALQNFLAARRDPLAFFGDVVRSSGDFVRFNLLHYRYVLVNDPNLIREFLIEKHDQFILTGGSVQGLSRLLGQGILTNHGDAWRRSRTHIQPLFQLKTLESYYPIMRERVQESIERWKTEFAGGSFSISRELLALSFRILCSTLFRRLPSFEEALQFSDAIWVLQSDGMIRFTNGGDLVPWLPLPRIRRVNKAVAALERIAANIIASGCPIPLDEVRSLLFAGTESPANTLCWSLKLLGEHPRWREALESSDLSEDNVEGFDALSKVLCETMRLYPAGWAFERHTCEDATLGGEPIAKGTRIFVSPYLLHRNQKFWRNPEEFDPQRFVDSATVAPGVPRYGYLPFGAGPRACVGGRMALAQMRITLGMLASQAPLEIVDPPSEPAVSPRGSFKLKLNRPLYAKLVCSSQTFIPRMGDHERREAREKK